MHISNRSEPQSSLMPSLQFILTSTMVSRSYSTAIYAKYAFLQNIHQVNIFLVICKSGTKPE